ncbi:hypothetical protein NADE_006410 [Nannochloris sp. 'desiccata']|nr:hypothetical protein NADE_006410 [Chlorella desiccata (nom. nud.)]
MFDLQELRHSVPLQPSVSTLRPTEPPDDVTCRIPAYMRNIHAHFRKVMITKKKKTRQFSRWFPRAHARPPTRPPVHDTKNDALPACLRAGQLRPAGVIIEHLSSKSAALLKASVYGRGGGAAAAPSWQH